MPRGCCCSSATGGIALINDESTKTFAIHRERGVRRALAASGLALSADHVFCGAMTEENGYRAARGAARAAATRRPRSSAPR